MADSNYGAMKIVDDPEEADICYAIMLSFEFSEKNIKFIPENIRSQGRLSKMHRLNVRPDRPCKEWLNYRIGFMVCGYSDEALDYYFEKYGFVIDAVPNFPDANPVFHFEVYARDLDTVPTIEFNEGYLKRIARMDAVFKVSISGV